MKNNNFDIFDDDDIFDDSDLDDNFDDVMEIGNKNVTSVEAHDDLDDDLDEDILDEESTIVSDDLDDDLDESMFKDTSDDLSDDDNDEDLNDEVEDNLDYTLALMLENSGISNSEDDLFDDIEYEDEDNSSAPTISSKSGNSLAIVDKTKFTFDVNKKLSDKELRSLQIMNETHNKLAGKSEVYKSYSRDNLIKIIKYGRVYDENTQQDLILSENQIKVANQFVTNIVTDMVGYLESISRLYISVEQSVKTMFKHRGSHSPYINMELPNKEAAIALNDLLRMFLTGNVVDFNNIPKITIPKEYKELDNVVVYDAFKVLTNSAELALFKTILLVNFFSNRKDLTTEDYKKITYYEMFNDKRYQYLILENHYNTIRDAVISMHDIREKEKQEIDKVLDLKLRQTIPAESMFYKEHIDLFDSISAKAVSYYTEKIINDFCYVESVHHSPHEHSFVCGNCGEENKEQTEFVKFIYLKAETYNDIFRYPIMGINKCEHCGKYNTLSGVQLNTFRNYHKLRNPSDSEILSILQSYSKNMYGYLTPSNDIYEAVLQGRFSSTEPDDYILEESVEASDSIGETNSESLDTVSNISPIHPAYIKALKEFRELISMYRDTPVKDLNVVEYLDECTLTYTRIIEKADVENGEPATEDITINILPNMNGIEKVIKVVCTLTGNDYATQRRNSILSLINFFVNSPLHVKLNTNTLLERRIGFETLDNVKEFYFRGRNKTEDSTEVLDILNQRAYVFDLEPEKSLDEIYNKYMSISESFINSKEKEFNDCIDVTLRDIFNNANLYAHVPISNIETLLKSNIFPYISNKKVWEMIEYISGLMLLNSTSEDIFTERVIRVLTDNQAKGRLKEQIGAGKKTMKKAIVALLSMPEVPINKLQKFKEECLATSSAARGVDLDDLIYTSKLVTAIVNRDLFGFYVAIDSCVPLLNSKIKEVERIKSMIKKYKDEASDFIEEYGYEDYDKVLFNLGRLFDKSEIDENLISVNKLAKYPVLPVRKDDETFEEYMDRCYSEELQAPMSLDKDFFMEMEKDMPYLLGLKAFSSFMTTNVSNVEVFLSGSEFLRMSLRNESPYWKDLLRLSDKHVNAIVNSVDDFDIYANSSLSLPDNSGLYLINAFYPTYNLNKNVLLVDKDWKVVAEYDESATPVDLVREQIKLILELDDNPEGIYISPKLKEIAENERSKNWN